MPGPVWVILPTYDEAENLEAVVGGGAAPPCPDAHVLVVDDSLARRHRRARRPLAAERATSRCCTGRRKAGLGRAYVAGFAHALARGRGLRVEMDADLSHDPADLPRLLAPRRGGADLVLGSRYVPGGGIDGLGPRRAARSRAPAASTRARVLGVAVRDLTGGFKCFRAERAAGDRPRDACARRATPSRSS